MRESCRLSPHRHRSRRFCETADATFYAEDVLAPSRSEGVVAETEGETSNSDPVPAFFYVSRILGRLFAGPSSLS